VDLPLEATEMAEAEVTALNYEIEFIYYKINTFTEDYVDEAILPAVEGRLGSILQLLDQLVMKWLKFKNENKGKPCIANLEIAMTEVPEAVALSEKKVRGKVAVLLAQMENVEQKVAVAGQDVLTGQNSSGGYSVRSQAGFCVAKKSDFFDLVSLLSVYCGLDLANPETELDSGVLETNVKIRVMERLLIK
jgi:hypothetical protein